MGLTKFDRWLTTDRAADAAEAEHDAFVAWCEAEGLDEDSDEARVEFAGMREAHYEAQAEARWEARMEAREMDMNERGEW